MSHAPETRKVETCAGARAAALFCAVIGFLAAALAGWAAGGAPSQLLTRAALAATGLYGLTYILGVLGLAALKEVPSRKAPAAGAAAPVGTPGPAKPGPRAPPTAGRQPGTGSSSAAGPPEGGAAAGGEPAGRGAGGQGAAGSGAEKVARPEVQRAGKPC